MGEQKCGNIKKNKILDTLRCKNWDLLKCDGTTQMAGNKNNAAQDEKFLKKEQKDENQLSRLAG